MCIDVKICLFYKLVTIDYSQLKKVFENAHLLLTSLI